MSDAKNSGRRALTAQEQRWRENLSALWNSRRDKSVTQELAAELLGYSSQATVSQYLRGIIALNDSAILKFARLLQVEPGQISDELADVTFHWFQGRGASNEADTIGERIAQARTAAGLSQTQLAVACQWEHQGRVSNYERDEREPGVDEIRALAAATGSDPVWLMFGDHSGGRCTKALSASERAVLELYRALPKAGQAMARRILACID